jgi:membrane protein implicated in regulation of membrane protease activity
MSLWPSALLFAGVFLVAELFTRTFYFLAVAIAFALLAALDALFRPGEVSAAVLFVVLSALLLLVAHLLRKRLHNEASRQSTDIDYGRVVTVVAHQDGRIRVRYRGALWTARLIRDGDLPPIGTNLTIVGREGNTLVLGPAVETPPSDNSLPS